MSISKEVKEDFEAYKMALEKMEDIVNKFSGADDELLMVRTVQSWIRINSKLVKDLTKVKRDLSKSN